MAQPIKWKGANKELGAAKGTEGFVQPMPVFSNGSVCVSCWELSEDDIRQFTAAIIRGEKPRLFVSVYYGPSQPPIYVGTEENVRNMVADFGSVWKKE